MNAEINIKLITVLMVLIQHHRNERRLYTEEEAAYLFGVSITTMARWRHSGAISFVNLGGDLIRYRWEHIQSRMDACEKLSGDDLRLQRQAPRSGKNATGLTVARAAGSAGYRPRN